MALVVQTNVGSMNAQHNLEKSSNALSKVFQRLSSGYRINSAQDDAAGLGVSMNLTAQGRSMAVAERNTNDGISLLQTADGAAGQIGDVLTRMRELATQSANGTLQNTDRDNIAVEFKSLQSEINRLAGSASFNGNNLVNGATSQFKLQIGAGTTEQLNVSIIGSSTGDYVALTTSAMGGATVISDITVSSATQAIAALTSIDSALTNVATARASFGAMSNRLENVVTGLQTKQTNYAAANSRIRDVDVASETANLARLQVLQQAGSSILSQANQGPQAALSLLR